MSARVAVEGLWGGFLFGRHRPGDFLSLCAQIIALFSAVEAQPLEP